MLQAGTVIDLEGKQYVVLHSCLLDADYYEDVLSDREGATHLSILASDENLHAYYYKYVHTEEGYRISTVVCENIICTNQLINILKD